MSRQKLGNLPSQIGNFVARQSCSTWLRVWHVLYKHCERDSEQRHNMKDNMMERAIDKPSDSPADSEHQTELSPEQSVQLHTLQTWTQHTRHFVKPVWGV